MNAVAITGRVASTPNYRVHWFVPTTDFDLRVDFARRVYTFHVRAMNDLAKTSRRYRVGDTIAVTGYLHAEPYDMPDGTVWQAVEIVAYEIDPHTPTTDDKEEMIVHLDSVVLTAHVAHWADDDHDRTAWLLDCLRRHNLRDWGDLDPQDAAANNDALRHGDGRLLSRYPLPHTLTDPTATDDAVWIITDDLADPDTLTTVLWPSDY